MNQHLTPARKRFAVCLAAAGAVLLLLCLFHTAVLERVGTFLDVGEPPVHADAALVLAGGLEGDRILKAAELKRQGYVPVIYVSGPRLLYETSECEISIPFAVRRGGAAADFRCIPSHAYNTLDEATACCAALERAGVKRLLLVTSSYHTRRATGIYRKACPKLALVTVASEDPRFQLRRWWQQREGKKELFMEYTKTLTSLFGI